MPLPLPVMPPPHVTFLEQGTPFWADWNFWVSIGTLLVACLTGWYAYETRKLRQGSDRAAADMKELANRSADAARDSAIAAKESAALARQQGESVKRSADAAEQSAAAATTLLSVGQRSWIVVDEVRVFSGAASFQAAAFHIPCATVLTNTGPTPAMKYSIWQGWRVGTTNPVESDLGTPEGEGVLAPRQIMLRHMDISLPPETASAVLSGTDRLFVYGVASYEDIFGKQHRTTWCLRYMPSLRTFGFFINLNTIT